jgi:hypothetical protein
MSYLPDQVNGNISGFVESPPLGPEKFISFYSVHGTDHLKDIFRRRCQNLGFRNLGVLPLSKEPLFDSLNKSLPAQNRWPLFALTTDCHKSIFLSLLLLVAKETQQQTL